MMHEKAVILEKVSKLIVVFNMVVFFFVLLSTEFNDFAYNHLIVGWTYQKSLVWFTASYLVFIFGILYLLPKKTGIIIYSIIGVFFTIVGVLQILYFKIMGTFFGINDLFLVSEGSHYFSYALKQIDFKLIIYITISTILLLMTIVLMATIEKPKTKFLNNPIIFILIIMFFLLRANAVHELGSSVNSKDFNAWSTPKNIYESYSDLNHSMQLSGLFEYTLRDVYLFVKKRFFRNEAILVKEIKNYLFNKHDGEKSNAYSNYYKDKNLIFIMLESVDDWLITESSMPTLNYMKKTGINFTNRYAPFFGGGRTFNSEFAANTGLYVPSDGIAIYDYAHNAFPYSLPNLFKQAGYTVNSLHYNNGEFYNRTNMHKALGYTNHYALYDMGIKDNTTYDSTLASNDQIYKLIVPDNDKFMSFVITFSTHLPYLGNPLCFNSSDELDCIKKLSHITDEFLNKLLYRLEQDGRIDDTVVILFSDHYAYGYDIDYLKKVKGTNEKNLLEKTPFIIWSKNIKPVTIDTLMDTADIAPTVANMFGLPFSTNSYLATDVFSDNHEPFVYFEDYSWFDGIIYYYGQKINQQANYISSINNKVKEIIKINNDILYTDYYQNGN